MIPLSLHFTHVVARSVGERVLEMTKRRFHFSIQLHRNGLWPNRAGHSHRAVRRLHSRVLPQCAPPVLFPVRWVPICPGCWSRVKNPLLRLPLPHRLEIPKMWNEKTLIVMMVFTLIVMMISLTHTSTHLKCVELPEVCGCVIRILYDNIIDRQANGVARVPLACHQRVRVEHRRFGKP